MARAPSDFREGVEAAAKWLQRHYPQVSLSNRMLAEVTGPDEGTEKRTADQIADFVLEQQAGHPSNSDVRLSIRRIGYAIRSGDWKSR